MRAGDDHASTHLQQDLEAAGLSCPVEGIEGVRQRMVRVDQRRDGDAFFGQELQCRREGTTAGADEADLVEVRDQVHMIRDRVRALAVDQRLTLDAVRARRPLLDIETRYDRADWSAGRFLEAVYREVIGAAGNSSAPPGP